MGSIFWWFWGLLALAIFAAARGKKKPVPVAEAQAICDSPAPAPAPAPLPEPATVAHPQMAWPVHHVHHDDMPGDQLVAFHTVMGELQNTRLTATQLADLSGPLIDALGDPRRAGKILVEALEGTDWDWPAWTPYAKREGHPTIQQVLSERDPGPSELLKQMLKPELLATAQDFGVTVKKTATKDDIAPLLLNAGAPQLQHLLQELLAKHRAKQRHKIYLQVAEGVANRISRVAHGQFRYKQMLHLAQYPNFSHWLFRVDNTYDHSKPPKRCRDLHGSILPHVDAAKKFPRLPCDRLDCCCDISIGTPESLAELR